jgi:hypothetical protein
MIGIEVRTRQSFPWLPAAMLGSGAALLTSAFILQIPHLGFAGVPLTVYGAIRLLTLHRRFRARFTESGLEIMTRSKTTRFSYDGLESVRRQGGPHDPAHPGYRREYAIQVAHRDGLLEIPSSIDHSLDEVYRFLFKRATMNLRQNVHPALADFAQKQQRVFGKDRVWCFEPRAHLWKAFKRSRFMEWCWTLLVSGLAWFIAGSDLDKYSRQEFGGWVAAGIIVFAVSLGCIICRHGYNSEPYHGPPRWQESSLIITPGGLALVQDDLQGELIWNDVKTIDFRRGPPMAVSSILLGIEGGRIVIPDIYNHPLFVIRELMNDCRFGRMDTEIGEANPAGSVEAEDETPSDQLIDLARKATPPTGIQTEGRMMADG